MAKETSVLDIEGCVAAYRKILEKRKEKLNDPLIQKFLASPLFENRFDKLIDRRLELQSENVSEEITVARDLTAKDIIALERTPQSCNADVLDAVTTREKGKAVLTFFQVDPEANEQEIELEYKMQELKPAHLTLVAAYNAADPDFARHNPNGTHVVHNGKRLYFVCYTGHSGDKYKEYNVGRHRWLVKWWAAGEPIE